MSCKLYKNKYLQKECDGCHRIEALFRRRRDDGGLHNYKIKTHDSFRQLESCAESGCIACQVFRKALWLRQITGQETRRLQNASQYDEVWVNLPPTWKSAIPGQTVLEISVGNPQEALKSATVYCTEKNDVGFVNLRVEPTDPTVLAEVRGWLKDCHENHNQCKNLRWSQQNPSNLVYIRTESQQLELRDTSQEELVRYAALSYPWGTETTNDPEEKKKMQAAQTTRENLSRRRQSFSVSDLPKTIQDAIQLTRSLDIPYIWVDAMCILPGDWNREASRMHEVYGNAHVTLCACSSRKSTDGLFHPRKAWQHRSRPCQLGNGQFLANFDMALKEIRWDTPLFSRGWTLQEERLSPRILYVCSQRIYWSCSCTQHTELGLLSLERPDRRRRQPFESPDPDRELRHPQRFLNTRHDEEMEDLHQQWLDIVKAYTRRNMFYAGDRFPAISGLAAQYLAPYTMNKEVHNQEYLAGLWRKSFAKDLAWSVQCTRCPNRPSKSLLYVAPAWSWASVPLCTTTTMQHDFTTTDRFELLEEPQLGKAGQSDKVLDVVKRGALTTSVKVRGPMRRFINQQSQRKEWEEVQAKNGGEDDYDFSRCISDFVHCRHPINGKVLAYEPNKQEIIGQLDYVLPEQDNPGPWHFVADDGLKDLYCLQIGKSSMLLLERYKDIEEDGRDRTHGKTMWIYRRVGVCNAVREMFFAAAVSEDLILV